MYTSFSYEFTRTRYYFRKWTEITDIERLKKEEERKFKMEGVTRTWNLLSLEHVRLDVFVNSKAAIYHFVFLI